MHPFVIAVSGAEDVAVQLERLAAGHDRQRPARRRASRDARAGARRRAHPVHRRERVRAHARAARTRHREAHPRRDGERDGASTAAPSSISSKWIATCVSRFHLTRPIAADFKINSALLSVAARVERRPQGALNCLDGYPRRQRPNGCRDQDGQRKFQERGVKVLSTRISYCTVVRWRVPFAGRRAAAGRRQRSADRASAACRSSSSRTSKSPRCRSPRRALSSARGVHLRHHARGNPALGRAQHSRGAASRAQPAGHPAHLERILQWRARFRRRARRAELLQQDPHPHRRPQRLFAAVLRRLLRHAGRGHGRHRSHRGASRARAPRCGAPTP